MNETSKLDNRTKTPIGPRIRRLTRTLHRDCGYLFAGLTIVYACSGLAVNHIGDWDPNFRHEEWDVQLEGPWPADERTAARQAAQRLDLGEVRDAFASDGQLEIEFPDAQVVLNLATSRAHVVAQRPRWLLRSANWLHLNRGKRAWTLIADAYALGLIFLVLSSLWMLPQKKGPRLRSLILAALGFALPIAFVAASEGPTPAATN